MLTTRIFVGIILAGLVGCTSVGPPAHDIPAAIANASGPADHQKIADYFEQKALSYDAEAAQHIRSPARISIEPAVTQRRCHRIAALYATSFSQQQGRRAHWPASIAKSRQREKASMSQHVGTASGQY
jgi:UDP-3-O-[3-hydroxymyristoyl] glucosamine N-acyltransferase